MGLEMESDSDKNSTGLSPNTVLPPPRHYSNIEKRNAKLKATRRDDLLRVKEGFTEISFRRYRSSSAKSIQSRPIGLESNIELKRGSIYQCSKEVRKVKTMGAIEGREKIELSRSSDSSFSFRIVDSLCSAEEESSRKTTSVTSVSSNSNASSVCRPSIEPSPSEGFIDFCLTSDGLEKLSIETAGRDIVDREKLCTETASRDLVEDMNFRCDEVVGPLNDGNELLERDTVLTFQKSHSAKLEMCYSPPLSGSCHSSRGNSKARFNPIRKMFGPFMKSKSLRSPLGYVVQPDEVKTTGMENMKKEFRKSLLHDFSSTCEKSEFNSQLFKKDQRHSVVANSPVHLCGLLKLENKQGVPFFEFSLNCPEEVIVARTWKENNAFNWVYTFHSVDDRKKSNASGWGSSDSNKDCCMVGQMQVSCYLCSELKDDGIFDDSMVTEFVLYDIAHARQSVISQDCVKCSSDATPPKHSNRGFLEGNNELNNESDFVKFKDRPKYASNKSNLCPWPSGDLGPDLEVAAVVIQVPFEKRESLKYKRGDKVSGKKHSNLLNFSMAEQRQKDHLESNEKVKVVIPTGNHGLPSAESRGPSSLLNRWRLGGGCDCGGWDMACPLTVFSNPNIQCAGDRPILDYQQPLELLVQGAKENTPALTMTVQEEGQYAVHFHAQLSTLQAFSICVAILHGTEASIAAGQDRSTQLPHCNSLKMLIEEEVKFLIDAVTKEDKKKVTKRVEEIASSYVINPPFSPIARV